MANYTFTPEEISSLNNQQVQLIDTRTVENFALSHIPGSLHLPLIPNFILYAKCVVDPTKTCILILDDDRSFDHIAKMMVYGEFQLEGYLKGGIESWKQSRHPLDTLPTIDVIELKTRLSMPNNVLIDVRTPTEFTANHIPKSLHYPLGKFDEKKCAAIPSESDIFLICGGGTRSSIMASNLKRNGIKNVHNVIGGMSAWNSQFASEKNMAKMSFGRV